MPDRFIPLPPASYAYLTFTQFEWCQVRYVFARELTHPQRAGQNPLDWKQAYEEAGLVVEALQAGKQPLAYGAREDEVEWKSMLCYASRYSHMTPADRAEARRRIAAGVPIWMISTVVSEPDLCDREILDDPEYQPYPPCIPSEVTRGVRDMAGSVAWGLGVLWIMRAFVDASRAMERKAKGKR